MGIFSKVKDSIAGSAGGIVSGIIGGGLDFASAKSLSNDQQAFNKEAYQNRYQWTMEDMKKAGLNPILAAGMGLGGGSSAQASLASAKPGTTGIMAASAKAAIALQQQQLDINTPEQIIAQWKSYGLRLAQQTADRLKNSGKSLTTTKETSPLPNIYEGTKGINFKTILPDLAQNLRDSIVRKPSRATRNAAAVRKANRGRIGRRKSKRFNPKPKYRRYK